MTENPDIQNAGKVPFRRKERKTYADPWVLEGLVSSDSFGRVDS